MQTDIRAMLPTKPATALPAKNEQKPGKSNQEMPDLPKDQPEFAELLVKTGKGVDEASQILTESRLESDEPGQKATKTAEPELNLASKAAQLYLGKVKAELLTGLAQDNPKAGNPNQASEGEENDGLMVNAEMIGHAEMPAQVEILARVQHSAVMAKVPLVAGAVKPVKKLDEGKSGPLTANSGNMLTKVRVDKTMQDLFQQVPQSEPVFESHLNIRAKAILEKLPVTALGPERQAGKLAAEMQIKVSHISQERHILPQIAVHPIQQVGSAIASALDTSVQAKNITSGSFEQSQQVHSGEAKLIRHLHITLHPENLGTVSARLVKANGGLEVVLEPSNSDLANRLKGDISQLAKQIHLAGISPDDMTIRIAVPDGANVQRGQSSDAAGQQSGAGSFTGDNMKDQASNGDRERRWNDSQTRQENDSNDNHSGTDDNSLYL